MKAKVSRGLEGAMMAIKRWSTGGCLVLAVALAAAAAVAAGTQVFVETNEEDFAAGRSEGVVWTNLGTLRLGRALDTLLAETDGVDYVADLAEAPDGSIYAVTGGAGRVYRLKDGKVALYATLPDKFLFSCAVGPKGTLYVGSGGTKGRIFRLEPAGAGEPKAEAIFEHPDVKYVWGLVWQKNGTLAAATGDKGLLLAVTPDGKSETLIDSEAAHVLCVALGPDGTLYAGTDSSGLVYRWADKKAFVLYQAEEAEIADLAVDAKGNLYVAGSSAAGGRRGGVTVTQTTIQVTPPAEGEPGRESLMKEKKEPNPAESETGESEQGGDADKPEKPAKVTPPGGPPTSPAASVAERLRDAMQAVVRGAAGQPAGGGPSRGTGASVYRISPDGIATRIFQGKDKMVLAIALADGRMLVGTGEEGRIYEVDLSAAEEQAAIAKVDPKQIMALLVTADGRAIVGTAAKGRLYAMSKGFANEGTYTSRAYDTGGSSRWGTVEWRAGVPAQCMVALSTRTGNLEDPDKGPWSDWSKPILKSPSEIPSPSARFIQFRVTMRSPRDEATPVLEQFQATYLRTNEPPEIASINVVAAAKGPQAQAAQQGQRVVQAVRSAGRGAPSAPQPREAAPQPIRIITWQASDPNGDELAYDLYFRGQGEEVWILLDDDLSQPQYPWDTSTVSDGWYEIKLVAGDRPDNPADLAKEAVKVSDPVLVDNTAPIVDRIDIQVRGNTADVRVAAHDSTSRLVSAAYTLDSSTDWHVLFPTDLLFDALKEEFHFTITGLGAGPHRLAVRVSDEADNTGHLSRALQAGK